MHVFWDCDKIKAYKKEIHKITQKIIGKTFALFPNVYLLNCKTDLCLDCDRVCIEFLHIFGKEIYTIVTVNPTDALSQYVDESGRYSFTVGKINLGPTSTAFGPFLKMLSE